MPCSFSDMPPRLYPSFANPAKIPDPWTRRSTTLIPGGQPPHSSAVQEDGSRADPVQRERPDPIGQAAARQLRLPGRRAETGDHLARVPARGAERGERSGPVALREALAGGRADQARVRPARLAQAQQAMEEDLPRRGREQVRAAQHLRHAHRRVVDDDRQLVGEDAVRAAQHEIADGRLRIELLLALQLVVEAHRTGRDPQPQRRYTGAAALGALRAGEARAGARVPGAERSEEHTSELQSRSDLVCRLLLEKKKDPPPNRAQLPANTTQPRS